MVVLKYLALYTVKGNICRDLGSQGNKDDNDEKGLISNATTLHVLYTFCYITSSSLHAEEVNVFFLKFNYITLNNT